jgi:hypothetical protein
MRKIMTQHATPNKIDVQLTRTLQTGLDHHIRDGTTGLVPLENQVGVAPIAFEFVDDPVEPIVLGIEIGNEYVIFISIAQLKQRAGIIQEDTGVNDVAFTVVHRSRFSSAKDLDAVPEGTDRGVEVAHVTEDTDPQDLT